MTEPRFGEKIPPAPEKPRTPMTPAGWLVLAFILLVIAAATAPLIIWLWRLSLGYA